MEDLASTISRFLGSEEGLSQLQAVARSLGLDPDGGASSGPQQNPQPPPAQEQAADSAAAVPGLDLNTMLLLGKAMAVFGQEDRNTELLRALRPHFSPGRAKRVDDAIRILQLIRLLPLVKDLGILPGQKGGDSP